MSKTLGRSSGILLFEGDVVTKTTIETLQPVYMRQFPGVFAPVNAIAPVLTTPLQVAFEMPRLAQVSDPLFLKSGIGVLQNLWAAPKLGYESDWRRKLRDHLLFQRQEHGLEVSEDFILKLAKFAYVAGDPCHIHGDATVSNLLYDVANSRWCWIDPISRPFIPSSRVVDVGKMLQSCWGYEAVLERRGLPALNNDLAVELCSLSKVPYNEAMRWCAIHLIRLLPYQEPEVRSIFEGLLEHSYWETLVTR